MSSFPVYPHREKVSGALERVEALWERLGSVEVS